MSKQTFSEYLLDEGFYFVNINDPNKTVYGQDILQSKHQKKEDEEDAKSPSKKKLKTTSPHRKLATYLQIVNAIQ